MADPPQIAPIVAPKPPEKPSPATKPTSAKAPLRFSCTEIEDFDKKLPPEKPDANAKRWFITPHASNPSAAVGVAGSSVVNPIWARNTVKPYIYGRCAFADMREAIRTAENKGHRVYLLAWSLVLDLQIADASGANTTVFDLLRACDARGVPVRAMLYDNNFPGYETATAVQRINTLTYGAAILDNRVAPLLGLGAHHQKLMFVRGRQGDIGFLGGMDLHPDRNAVVDPLHDVHLRISGPATASVLRVFEERWRDHPESGPIDSKGGLPTFAPPVSTPTPASGSHLVQIGRTYPNTWRTGLINSGSGAAHYSFLQSGQGEQTSWEMIQAGIRQAERFIYVEDQYLVSEAAANELAAALQRKSFQKLIILACATWLGDLKQLVLRRSRFFEILRKADPTMKKFGLFQLRKASQPEQQAWCGPYVHAKLWIFDDRFAIVGSANCNRRGYTHDSEVVAGIADDDTASPRSRVLFAHSLRMALWRKHLALKDESLSDFITASAYWDRPPTSAMISRYDPTEVSGPVNDFNPAPSPMIDLAWDKVFDPDGTVVP